MAETDVYIVVSATVGLILIIWKNKRQFNRLNQLGIEQFRSYGHKIIATAFDVMLFGTGIGLLGAAVVGYLVEYAQPLVAVIFLFLIIGFFEADRNQSRK